MSLKEKDVLVIFIISLVAEMIGRVDIQSQVSYLI